MEKYLQLIWKNISMFRAEAERMRMKASAYKQYGDAAILSLVLESLPQVTFWNWIFELLVQLLLCWQHLSFPRLLFKLVMHCCTNTSLCSASDNRDYAWCPGGHLHCCIMKIIFIPWQSLNQSVLCPRQFRGHLPGQEDKGDVITDWSKSCNIICPSTVLLITIQTANFAIMVSKIQGVPRKAFFCSTLLYGQDLIKYW